MGIEFLQAFVATNSAAVAQPKETLNSRALIDLDDVPDDRQDGGYRGQDMHERSPNRSR